ncbi:Response regulator receiver domain-containing protein [Rhodospirillales bacterium URHD0017]|nr:Response regulator receiver domain-containing protein [Rhodospirillales bacterium URHD0017]
MSGRRVLVVEDEVIVGMLLEDMLGELGCEVVAISTHLEEALGLARRLDIDFALLDINLDGHQSFPWPTCCANAACPSCSPPATAPRS